MPILLFGVLALFFSPVPAFSSEIMFEGYYKIELAGKHIGYAIQRYEFEPKDKSFTNTSFMRLKIGEQVQQESLKAKTNDKFQPLSYQYTATAGNTIKTIDGSFKGDVMTVKITDGKKVKTETSKIPKGTFFSSFLTYLMLQKKLELNQAFQYSAIAEEDGGSYNGKALIESKEPKAGYEAYRILNSFKGEKFVSKVGVVKDAKDPAKNVRGDVLGTASPSKNLQTTLVSPAALATEGHILPNKTLIALFGGMPTGNANLVAKEK
jgi:hypothetical protein